MGYIPTQYLVAGVAGKGTAPAATVKPTAAAARGNYKSVVIDLNDYFKDVKTPSLSYEAVSSDIKIVSLSTSATTAPVGGNDLVADGKLTVTAAGVGPAPAKTATAMITVRAFDGTNEAETATFSVVVVKSNAKPIATGVVPIADLVDKPASAGPPVVLASSKLYETDGTITLDFKASIKPGLSGRATDLEPLTYRAFVVGTEKVVSVTTPVPTGVVNTYSVDITAKTPPSVINTAKVVKIFAMDSFGAEAEITSFKVVVNTPPTKYLDLTDVILFRGGTESNNAVDARTWIPSSNFSQVFYQLTDYFDDLELTSLTDATPPVTTIGDTTCTFSTSPSQPTGRLASAALITPVIPVDPVKATTRATVNNGTGLGLETVLRNDADSDIPAGAREARVEVASAVMQPEIAADANANPPVVGVAAVTAAGVGVVTLTIMCEDPDKTVESSARILVRAGTN